MSIIDISGLYKSYDKIQALDDLDVSVDEGEIYGFLGPNGAGKTTAIKIIMGLLEPDTGEVTVNGLDALKEGVELRKSIRYLPERVTFYDRLSVKENLSFFCDLKGCSKEVIPYLVKEFKIEDYSGKKVKELSRGLLQRLGLAQTMIGDPDILILDEPTSGLDPEIRKWVKKKILSMKEEGKTILLSSHILSEVQELCDRVGVISNGSMIAEDDVRSLISELNLRDRLELSVDSSKDVLSTLEKIDFVERARVEEGKIVVYCKSDRKMDVIKRILDEGFEINNFRVKEADLEEIFVRLMENRG